MRPPASSDFCDFDARIYSRQEDDGIDEEEHEVLREDLFEGEILCDKLDERVCELDDINIQL